MICYVRVYLVGQADTSAKQRIDATYLEARGNASRLVPYLNACTLNLRNHLYKTPLKADARPQEAETHSANSRWKHIAHRQQRMASCLGNVAT